MKCILLCKLTYYYVPPYALSREETHQNTNQIWHSPLLLPKAYTAHTATSSYISIYGTYHIGSLFFAKLLSSCAKSHQLGKVAKLVRLAKLPR